MKQIVQGSLCAQMHLLVCGPRIAHARGTNPAENGDQFVNFSMKFMKTGIVTAASRFKTRNPDSVHFKSDWSAQQNHKVVSGIALEESRVLMLDDV